MRLTNKALITVKKEEVSAASIPKIIPQVYLVSTLKIIAIAPIMIIPKTNSYRISFLLKKMGSIIDVKSVPVAKATKVTETFEILIAL